MGNPLRMLLVVLAVGLPLGAQASDQLSLFDALMEYTNPNPQLWRKEAERHDPTKGLLLLKHTGVVDTAGNTVQPTLAVIYERLPSAMHSLADYVGMARERTPFPIDDIIIENDRIIYFCRYDRGTTHTLVIAHFLYEGTGVQVMGDAPGPVYDRVESDIKRFIDSIRFRKSVGGG